MVISHWSFRVWAILRGSRYAIETPILKAKPPTEMIDPNSTLRSETHSTD